MNKLTVVQINTFPYKATGTIMMNLHHAMSQNDINSYVVWGRGRKPENDHEISMEDKLGIMIHGVYSRLTDRTGFASKRATTNLINKLDKIKPDIVHIHNLHGYYINIKILFRWIQENNIKVMWTLHDCWPITGHCTHFDSIGCNKWMTRCFKCEQLQAYPRSIILDSSYWNWNRKKELFTELDMTIVTPSYWLAGIVKRSFLGEYPVKVINNGIDLKKFHPANDASFRKKMGLYNKIILLGVANDWREQKGLNDFVKLNELLNKDIFQIVLVGLTSKQIRRLPRDIIGLKRSNNVDELAGIYSSADYFINLTYEDTYPTVNLEAISCGTPVITYRTGGSPESVYEGYGYIIEKGDIVAVAERLEHGNLKKNSQITSRDDINFSLSKMITQYMDLYKKP